MDELACDGANLRFLLERADHLRELSIDAQVANINDSFAGSVLIRAPLETLMLIDTEINDESLGVICRQLAATLRTLVLPFSKQVSCQGLSCSAPMQLFTVFMADQIIMLAYIFIALCRALDDMPLLSDLQVDNVPEVDNRLLEAALRVANRRHIIISCSHTRVDEIAFVALHADDDTRRLDVDTYKCANLTFELEKDFD